MSCQLFLLSLSVFALSQVVVIIQHNLLNVFKNGIFQWLEGHFDTSCQTVHFSVSETITAGLKVSAGVDILSSLACPTFSIHPTWPILMYFTLDGPVNRMSMYDIYFSKRTVGSKVIFFFLIEAVAKL